MIDPFESYEKKINDLKDIVRKNAKSARASTEFLLEERNENRRLREACRQTNKGVHRLRVRCDRQARKIKDLKDALIEAMAVHSARGGEIKQSWVEAFEGRRPTEKAT